MATVTPAIQTRRAFVQALLGASLLPLAAACAATQPPQAAAPNPLVKPTVAPNVPLTAVLASSELAVGRNRLGLGLLDARNQPITSGAVRVELFKVNPANGTAEKRLESDAQFRAVELLNRGIWVTGPTFNEPGPWGAQVTVTRPGDAQPLAARLSFEVRPQFSAPGYGAPAPRSATVVPKDVGGDISRICSNSPPCDLHAASLADLIGDGQKPLVLLFATPALCTSATCAPELQAIQALKAKGYAERASFLHVEIYQAPFEQQKPVRAVEEWKLPSEPWVFVVDKTGIVRDRFEGAAPVEELEPALQAVL